MEVVLHQGKVHAFKFGSLDFKSTSIFLAMSKMQPRRWTFNATRLAVSLSAAVAVFALALASASVPVLITAQAAPGAAALVDPLAGVLPLPELPSLAQLFDAPAKFEAADMPPQPTAPAAVNPLNRNPNRRAKALNTPPSSAALAGSVRPAKPVDPMDSTVRPSQSAASDALSDVSRDGVPASAVPEQAASSPSLPNTPIN